MTGFACRDIPNNVTFNSNKEEGNSSLSLFQNVDTSLSCLSWNSKSNNNEDENGKINKLERLNSLAFHLSIAAESTTPKTPTAAQLEEGFGNLDFSTLCKSSTSTRLGNLYDESTETKGEEHEMYCYKNLPCSSLDVKVNEGKQQKKSRMLNVRSKNSNDAAKSATDNDPYRIVIADLIRINNYMFRLKSGSDTVTINIEDLDFNYFWMKFLATKCSGAPEAQTSTCVCARLHRSKRVTDIRLIGYVDRVVRNKFGFIAHHLFPGNMYFRTTDMDQCGPSSRRYKHSHQSINAGALVAFRVGRKDDRVWALRVWKVPNSINKDRHTHRKNHQSQLTRRHRK